MVRSNHQRKVKREVKRSVQGNVREVKIRARTVRDGHKLGWAGRTRRIIFSD